VSWAILLESKFWVRTPCESQWYLILFPSHMTDWSEFARRTGWTSGARVRVRTRARVLFRIRVRLTLLIAQSCVPLHCNRCAHDRRDFLRGPCKAAARACAYNDDSSGLGEVLALMNEHAVRMDYGIFRTIVQCLAYVIFGGKCPSASVRVSRHV
jgi:hypothetical protein